ncbi:Domain of Uncharacterised Function with PDB structure [Niallia circulans]|uniref:DUF3850 domain-containing protein n=1 Tax=Niallia circulans TaxID=1397 RepID=UPI00077CA5B8|nr:DUF3850 domain-containing protein [Niallia circulans]MDR4318411.1 DUF3850 domain-containing protein [Niallia circulans]MED3839266.1 DUF3850 domain-containing protein [Niallia circulans]MED4242389.1 DUF3850 domain-containing protein [Niallia circulans]MED4250491.1 DUF3850 domain-containing protein [Niallia circulans]QKH59820.1 DUF3850 domain-containing protein [Niallia circulans]
MKRHELKIEPQYYSAVLAGVKTFEIRRNDRDFKIGDEILLTEFVPEENRYTNRELLKQITYITDYAQKDGYVVMGIK